jgi:coenzyme PQQ precursor peptide PqqA
MTRAPGGGPGSPFGPAGPGGPAGAAAPAVREAFDRALHAGATLFKCSAAHELEGRLMAWTTPILVEICIGLEINGYLPAEF